MKILIAYGVVTGLLLAISCIVHFSKAANRRLPACLSWEQPYEARHDRTAPRLTRPRMPWRARLAYRLRACAVAASARPASAGTVPDPPSGAVPLHVRATSSDGFPAVAFRTAHTPELPDVIA
jgi:hypothetical protein